MKKIKILTSRITIGTIAVATPIITTSCSCSNNQYSIEDIIFDAGNPQINTKSLIEEFKIYKDDEELDIGVKGSKSEYIIDSVEANLDCDTSLNFDKSDISIKPSSKGVKKLSLTLTISKKDSASGIESLSASCNVTVADENYMVYDGNVIDFDTNITQEFIDQCAVL